MKFQILVLIAGLVSAHASGSTTPSGVTKSPVVRCLDDYCPAVTGKAFRCNEKKICEQLDSCLPGGSDCEDGGYCCGPFACRRAGKASYRCMA